MPRFLVILGLALVLLGLLWPLISKIGLGHLPGDIRIERKGFSFYFPVTSSLIISALLSFLLWLFRK